MKYIGSNFPMDWNIFLQGWNSWIWLIQKAPFSKKYFPFLDLLHLFINSILSLARNKFPNIYL